MNVKTSAEWCFELSKYSFNSEIRIRYEECQALEETGKFYSALNCFLTLFFVSI